MYTAVIARTRVVIIVFTLIIIVQTVTNRLYKPCTVVFFVTQTIDVKPLWRRSIRPLWCRFCVIKVLSLFFSLPTLFVCLFPTRRSTSRLLLLPPPLYMPSRLAGRTLHFEDNNYFTNFPLTFQLIRLWFLHTTRCVRYSNVLLLKIGIDHLLKVTSSPIQIVIIYNKLDFSSSYNKGKLVL